ncbi:MAG: T9SS type A sorting domain-containing protein, partial [Saprospiraceae bacterium]|nr:T9SS type A sorting domain-containing protein [Saprospiraceae bacterium]
WNAAGAGIVLADFTDQNGCAGQAGLGVVVEICSNAQEAALPDVRVWPNPFVSRIDLQIDRLPAAGARVQLLDAAGRVVLEQPAAGTAFFLNTEGLPPGSYWLRWLEQGRLGVWPLTKG